MPRVKPRALAVTAGLVLAAGGLGWWWWRGGAEPAPAWRLSAVERGDVRATVSSTGTLQAVTTVEVGTQISGVVEELLADYNDAVEAGQVLARIDTSILAADVEAAQAAVNLRVAERDQAKLDLGRTERLAEQGAVSPEEREQAQTALAMAEATLSSARVSLSRARRNLGYATITAPITGTVVERDVEVGQTVNAGMTAPRLFLLAGDLSTMQILASVDEADIGRIAEGQAVEFTVAAYPSDHFAGSVRQVRLQSTTAENVVTYTVVIDVPNPDGRLLPGMTATVDFVVSEATDVLCVAGAALRFTPEPARIAGGAEPEAAKAEGRGERPGGGSGRRGGDGKGKLWVAGPDGLVSPIEVETGLAGSTCTELRGEGVTEGMEVVSGVERADAAGGERGSPLSGSSSGQSRRPGGF